MVEYESNLIVTHMKNNIIRFLLVLVALFTVAIGAYFYGRTTKENELDNPTVTSQSVFEMIEDQYFVVTKTSYVNQKARLSIEENSDWSDLLWMDVINAEGLVRIDIGVDLSELRESDIKVDKENKTIEIDLPESEILTSTIEGDVTVESERGLVTSIEELFEEEADDYNLAVSELIKLAQESISEDLYEEAREDSLNIIENILESIGYSVL